jgi:hypothetical protein
MCPRCSLVPMTLVGTDDFDMVVRSWVIVELQRQNGRKCRAFATKRPGLLCVACTGHIPDFIPVC